MYPRIFPLKASIPRSWECSTRNRWILPIRIGYSAPSGRFRDLNMALHFSSQRRWVGQSTPQAPPKILLSLIVRIAPVTFLKRSFRIKSAGWVSAGHPSEQGASWQRRHRSASAMAWGRSKPLRISLKLSA